MPDCEKSKIYRITNEEFDLLNSGDLNTLREFSQFGIPFYNYSHYVEISKEEARKAKLSFISNKCNKQNLRYDDDRVNYIKFIFKFDEVAASDFSQRFDVKGEDSEWEFVYYPGYTSGPPEDCYPDEYESEIKSGGLSITYGGKEAISLNEKAENIEASDSEDGYRNRHGGYVSQGYGRETDYIEEIQFALKILNGYFQSIEDNGWFIPNDDYITPSEFKNYSDFIGSIAEEAEYALEWFERPGLPDYEIFCSKEKK